MTTTTAARATQEAAVPARSPVYSALVGLSAVAMLLQGLWAGLFLQHDGERDAAQSWIEVHARGADVAIVLAAAATVYAFVKLRERKDLWLGAAVLTVLLLAEAYIGGLVRDDGKDALTVVHVPLAMALMALAVWLPFRATGATCATRARR
jgi:heme A synthase